MLNWHIRYPEVKSLLHSWFQTFAVFWMLYAFFWVIPRHLNFVCRRFGTLSLFHLHRRIGVETYTYPPMKMKQSVPKRRHTKFRRRGITQKKAYKFVTVNNRCFKNPPSASVYMATCVRIVRVVPLSLLSRFFMRTAACEMRTSYSIRLSTFLL